MKCPRCQSSITATPDADGFMTCPGCSARLRSRSAPATVGALAARGQFPDATNPNATLPPGTPLPRIPRPGSPEARAALAEGPARSIPLPRPPADDAGKVMRAPRDVPREAGEDAQRAAARNGANLDALMAEVKAMRRTQEEILVLLRAGWPAKGEARPLDVADELGLPIPPLVRARLRKAVLLIDDDPETRTATAAALEAAEIPVRSVSEGRSALAAIAEDKPDVIVMELDIAGAMAGKDVINLIKATMEWVDIPIVLYSRAPITSQREARTVHGADDFVSKQDGTDLLLARVVTQFRRG
ncbi:MAG TPA: response regulator [Vicinamibacteria bacterium]|jgi:CheY-like chemotaxis protein|nr:response regulator [Vicinamibacteria bacterium]